MIHLRVQNEGEYPVTLYMDKNYFKNFTIVARGSRGRRLPLKDTFFRKRYEKPGDPFFTNFTGTEYAARAIIIQPNETLERELILQGIAEVKKEGSTREKLQIQAFFYPNPEQTPHFFIRSSNQIMIYIDDPLDHEELQPDFNVPTDTPFSLTPQEVVYLTLSAEYSGDWSNYFKYLSIADLIKDYPEYAKRYMSSQKKGKISALNDFRAYLRDNRLRRLTHFKIIRNNKRSLSGERSDSIAFVHVKASRVIEGFQRKFLYTYYLTKSQALWKITGIESQLLN